MNLLELYDNTKKYKAWRGTGYSQNSNWILKNIVPFKGLKTLLIQAECFGQTVDAIHVVNIQFSGIDYRDEPVKNGDMYELEFKGQMYYFVRPTLKTECTVRCSCPDFVYRSSYACWIHKVLFGSKPKKYIKKTNRKPVNPDNIPIICKHLFQTQSLLHTEGILA